MARILYFTRDYTTHDRRFLEALAGTQHQVFYLQLERRGHRLEERPLPGGIKAISWTGGRASVRLWDVPAFLPGFKRVIASVQPDLVHTGPLQTCAFLAALSGFRPLVSMSWGSDILRDADRNFIWRWITRFTLLRSDVLLGDCHPVRQKARSLGMADEKIVTFPWGVDLEQFSPPGMYSNSRVRHPKLAANQSGLPEESGVEPHVSSRKFTLLSTRRWEPVYGVDVIAHAFVRAARQFPELRLVMLGDGSQSARLRQVFERGGIIDRVSLPGQVSQADLPGIYRSADLYISASHSDGTSISLLEAMACGRPVLVSDIPGNREWVEPGVNGWLFPDGDVKALEKAMVEAVDEREQLTSMGCAGRRLAERRADWRVNFQELLRAYELALK